MPHWVEFIFLQWLPWLLRMDRPGRPLSAKSIMLRLFLPSEISKLSSNFNNQILVFSRRQRLWQLDKGDKPNNSGLVTPGEFETLDKTFWRGESWSVPIPFCDDTDATFQKIHIGFKILLSTSPPLFQICWTQRRIFWLVALPTRGDPPAQFVFDNVCKNIDI